MADTDRIDAFFDELGRRGHDPLLSRLHTTGRFEIVDGDGGHTEAWTVAVTDGDVTVSRGGGDIDWVIRAARSTLKRIIDGEASALESLMRGTLSVTLIDETQRFSLLTRLFAGPPESRGRPGSGARDSLGRSDPGAPP